MSSSIFDGLSTQEVDRVVAAGNAIRLPEGWSPIGETTPADKAYVITAGEVSVRRAGAEIARLGPGAVMGEAALVNKTLRTATIVALTPLEVIHFTSEAIERLAAEVPAFGVALRAAAAERLGSA
jgi:CRP-like cAMP-binding protein